jgi:hypothetical protein
MREPTDGECARGREPQAMSMTFDVAEVADAHYDWRAER